MFTSKIVRSEQTLFIPYSMYLHFCVHILLHLFPVFQTIYEETRGSSRLFAQYSTVNTKSFLACKEKHCRKIPSSKGIWGQALSFPGALCVLCWCPHRWVQALSEQIWLLYLSPSWFEFPSVGDQSLPGPLASSQCRCNRHLSRAVVLKKQKCDFEQRIITRKLLH